MIDTVVLVHTDGRLDDLARVTLDRLTDEDRVAWLGWQRARHGRLAGLHRAQVRCGVAGGAVAACVMLSAISDRQDAGPGMLAGIAGWVAVALFCAALFIELTMAGFPGYQPVPVRVRLDLRARERVGLQALRDSADDESLGGARAAEARLVVVARTIASAITGSAGWGSDQLDRWHLRCDVDGVLLRIARDAVELRRWRRDGIPLASAGAADTDPGAARWASLLDRVGWLLRYHRQLDTLLSEPAGGTESGCPRSRAFTYQAVADLRFTVLALTWH
ncbi:MAG TPA: hypothetical protein VIU11_20375 [Nakamurella sp.]